MTLDSRVAGRVRGIRPLTRHLGVLLHGQPVYCVSCGHPGGFVTTDLPPGVIFLCGQEDGCGCGCEARFGVPPEMVTKTPDPEDFVRTP